MNLFRRLSALHLYVRYFFTVVDRHSIQAPFAYHFYDQLVKAIKRSKPVVEIEIERQSFISDSSVVSGDDFGAGTKLIRSAVSSIARFGISSKKRCIFLHELANVSESATCIELGTSLGIATAYIAQAKPMNQIYSFEGNKILAGRAVELLRKLKIDNVQIIEGNIDNELPSLMNSIDTVDLGIIDANHTKNALIAYYNLLQSKMNSGGIIFVDDIRWSVDMFAGWKELYQKQEVSLSMEFSDHGLLFFKKGIQKRHYTLAI